MVIDSVGPSFSRMIQIDKDDGEECQVIKLSIGGYRDAVLGVDQSTGFCHLVGRFRKWNPHLLLQRLINKLIGRWKCLKTVTMDAEFVTDTSLQLKEQLNLCIKQAVPGMHARVMG